MDQLISTLAFPAMAMGVSQNIVGLHTLPGNLHSFLNSSLARSQGFHCPRQFSHLSGPRPMVQCQTDKLNIRRQTDYMTGRLFFG